MEPFSETDIVAQICFVTHDVDASAKWFSELMGKEVPPLAKGRRPRGRQGDPQRQAGDRYRQDPHVQLQEHRHRVPAARSRAQRLAGLARQARPELPPHRLPHPQPHQEERLSRGTRPQADAARRNRRRAGALCLLRYRSPAGRSYRALGTEQGNGPRSPERSIAAPIGPPSGACSIAGGSGRCCRAR